MNKVKFDHPTIERMFTCACGHDRSAHAWNHIEGVGNMIPCKGLPSFPPTGDHCNEMIFHGCDKRCKNFQIDNLDWLRESR